jgi:excisionase family DNA binding protein
MTRRFLTVLEAAAILGESRSAIYARIKAGQLPATRTPIPGSPGKGSWTIPASAVEAIAAQREKAALSEAQRRRQGDSLHSAYLRIHRARKGA